MEEKIKIVKKKKQVICHFCKKPINSKKELLVVWRGIWPPTLIKTFHKKCYNKAGYIPFSVLVNTKHFMVGYFIPGLIMGGLTVFLSVPVAVSLMMQGILFKNFNYLMPILFVIVGIFTIILLIFLMDKKDEYESRLSR